MNENIDLDLLTRITGDPFADTGGRVIKYLLSLPQFEKMTLVQILAYVTDIYVKAWDGKLHPFFLNGTITQPSYNLQKKLKGTAEYYRSLIDETAEDGKMGTCAISGVKGKVYLAGRHNHILSGSFKFVNYYNNFEPGIYFCKEILIRIFFVPFGVLRIADKLAIIISNNLDISDFFVANNCKANLESLDQGMSQNVIKSVFNNPANAIFRFIDEYTQFTVKNRNGDCDLSNSELQIIHFSNMGNNPQLAMYKLDAPVFSFYTYARTNFATDWKMFVTLNYKIEKGYEYDQELDVWKKDGEEISFEDYSKWKNYVLNNLLNGRPIIKQFLWHSERHFFEKGLVNSYSVQICGMKSEALEIVKKIAEYLMDGSDDLIKKSLMSLNSAGNQRDFRQFLVKLQKNILEDPTADNMFDMDDFSNYLLPEKVHKGYWSEIRDHIVMGMYLIKNKRKLEKNNQ